MNKNFMIFDTETSDKHIFEKHFSDSCQPRMLSFSGLLCNDTGEVLNTFSCLIKTSKDVVISKGAFEAHKLTHEILNRHGLPRAQALSVIDSMIQTADVAVAFNSDFDRRILNTEFYLARRLPPFDGQETPEDFCMMKAMTDVCQIPSPQKKGEFKWPNLQQAYRHYFNEDLKGWHGSAADTQACARIFFEHRKRTGQADGLPAGLS